MADGVALGIFAVTFVLLAARRLGRLPLERGPVALFGGLLMLMVGALSPAEAIAAVDLGTLALLLGMMLLAAALGDAGFFDLAAGFIARVARHERGLVWGTLVGSAVLSALFLNDTIALLLPPGLLLVLRWMHLPVFRTLAACAIGVNLGSLWTPIGNPQNAYLATVHGIGFLDFALHMTPLVLFGLLVAGLLLARGASTAPFGRRPDTATVTRPLPLYLGLGALSLTLVLFVASGRIGMPLWAIAITSGVMVLAMVPSLSPDATSRGVLARVNGNLLMLFVGLFLLLRGAENAGLTTLLFDRITLGSSVAWREVAHITAVTFVASNLFSNVPAVLLLDGPVSALDPETYPMLLAATATLAGNTTVLASAATLIVAEQSEAARQPFPFWRFAGVGGVVTLVTLVAAVPYFVWLGS